MKFVFQTASHVVGHGFMPKSGHTKEHQENGTNCLPAVPQKITQTNLKVWKLNFMSQSVTKICIKNVNVFKKE